LYTGLIASKGVSMESKQFVEEMNALVDQIEIMILDNDPAYLAWLESQFETCNYVDVGCEFDR
jgi:hypothetical protein